MNILCLFISMGSLLGILFLKVQMESLENIVWFATNKDKIQNIIAGLLLLAIVFSIGTCIT